MKRKTGLLFSNYFSILLNEGGNAFSTAERIEKNNIIPTLDQYKHNVLFKIGIKESDIITLGSVGKKDTSGDIDLGISFDTLVNKFKTVDLHEIILNLEKEVSHYVIDAKGNVGGAQVYTLFSQYDQQKNGLGKNVQIDLMVGKLEWLQNFYVSGYSKDADVETYLKTKYKGVYRNLLITAMLSAMAEKLSETEIKKYTFSGSGAYEVIKTIKGIKGNLLVNPKTISRIFISDNFKEFFQSYFDDKKFNPEKFVTFETLFLYIKNNKKTKPFIQEIIKLMEISCLNNKIPIPEELSEE